MIKIIKIILVPLFFLITITSFAQSTTPYQCFIFDFDNDTAQIENIIIKENINCLEINGAVNENALNNLFSKIILKENILKITLINYTGKNLPHSTFAFTKLKHFSLVSSPQVNFSKLFRNLQKFSELNTLELDDNESRNIPNNIKYIKNLNALVVKNYDIVDARKLFRNLSSMTSLRHLVLSSTGKIEYDKKTVFPKHLISLDLSDNWLTYLPDNISKAGNIETLLIQDNNFKEARDVISVIGKLPLKKIEVSCYDLIDSLIYVKIFPDAQRNISVYRDFQKAEAFKYSTPKDAPLTFIKDKYYQNIKPPIGEPEIDRKKYTIDAQKSQTLLYQSGTVIKIPDNAFIDHNGMPVKGNVNIHYREFSDIIDVLANGLTMKYDSGGAQHNFQTAGMFEIFASKGEQEVFLAQGKQIEFDYATIDTSSGFNLYNMDSQNNWVYNTPLQNDVRIVEPNPNPAYRLYNTILKKDYSFFDDRYKDSIYARTSKIPLTYYMGKRKTDFPFFKIKRAQKLLKDKEARKMPSFYIEKPSYLTYRELSIYRGYSWIYTGSLNKKDFAKKYISRKKYTDIRISYLPDEYVFEIELKTPHGFESFKAFPLKSKHEPDSKKYDKTYIKLDTRYDKTLYRVQARFDKKINKTAAQEQKRAWDAIYALMSPEEKLMSKEQWMEYASRRLSQERDSLNKVGLNYNNLIRNFQIDGFGIYNIDRIYKTKNNIEFLAFFNDALGNSISTSEISFVDMTNNAIIRLPYFAGSKVIFDGTSETAFFLSTVNGMVAIVDKNNVRNTLLTAGIQKEYNFTAYEIDPSLLSTSELRKLLGF